MRRVMLWKLQGGRMGPPLPVLSDLPRYCRKGTGLALLSLAVLGTVTVWSQPPGRRPRQLPPGGRAAGRIPQGQTPPRQVPGNVGRPNPGILRPQRTPEERAALQLLRKMLKPIAEYRGVQVTVVNGAHGATSEQEIEGDTKGKVRIVFNSPEAVRGDIMLIAPGSFHSFHRLKNTVDVANWPTEWNDESKRLFTLLLNGSVIARQVGEERIAGRNAGIVEMAVQNPSDSGVRRKFWIDEETGILLKIEKLNARGDSTSTTTMKSITITPTPPVNPLDFLPQQFQGLPQTPLFPESQPQFRTVQEAAGRLPLQPLEPTTLPNGFSLNGVWGFPAYQTVLMRFTDGVMSFSLYQRLMIGNKAAAEDPKPKSFAHYQQNWKIQTPRGVIDVQYIGHLTRDQAQSLYNSLKSP